MSYNKLGFTSGQTLKAEHLNHMENGIEALANNVQIKKVVFTDRPTMYQWLMNNYSKVIYCNVITSQYDWYVKYHVHYYFINDRDNVCFGLVQINSWGDDTLVPSIIRLTNNDTSFMVDAGIKINTDDTVTGSHVEFTSIPDEYWSAMGIEGTIYYFDE